VAEGIVVTLLDRAAAITVGRLIEIAGRRLAPELAGNKPFGRGQAAYLQGLVDLITEAAGLNDSWQAEVVAAITESAVLAAWQAWIDDLKRQAEEGNDDEPDRM
jgi:hypothetical protein